MPVHHFTLIVDGPDLQDDAIIDRLFEAGCDDAAVGRIDGIQYVDFDREAASLDDAVLSAVTVVEHVDGVSVVRVADAGLVSTSDNQRQPGTSSPSGRVGSHQPAPAVCDRRTVVTGDAPGSLIHFSGEFQAMRH